MSFPVLLSSDELHGTSLIFIAAKSPIKFHSSIHIDMTHAGQGFRLRAQRIFVAEKISIRHH